MSPAASYAAPEPLLAAVMAWIWDALYEYRPIGLVRSRSLMSQLSAYVWIALVSVLGVSAAPHGHCCLNLPPMDTRLPYRKVAGHKRRNGGHDLHIEGEHGPNQ
jgi:hypothetical protein